VQERAEPSKGARPRPTSVARRRLPVVATWLWILVVIAAFVLLLGTAWACFLYVLAKDAEERE
jgi:hypothetical protein